MKEALENYEKQDRAESFDEQTKGKKTSYEIKYQLPSSNKDEINKSKPIPFFLMLVIGEKLLHNSMLDLGASTNIMPKQIVEALQIQYELLDRGIMQLDGKKIQAL